MAEIRAWVAKPKGNIRVYDGDTFYSDTLDVGWGASLNKPKFRIAKIDTPEKSWRASSDRERALSLQAKKFLEDLIFKSDDVLVYSEDGRGKYGRWLVSVVCDGVDAGTALIEAGLARPYDGGTKSTEPW